MTTILVGALVVILAPVLIFALGFFYLTYLSEKTA
jgi:hypothetical protein